ncbi:MULTISPECIES: hypothetical protein [unclassified Paracoccus (in: a-proteobacteria)]|uniref:hypothetical protein n=1 Tax=unclassified Paracoccus (in: a-proteobacteria) TaxID=2688777 RepID=UPI001C720D26|nr:MULTISPECIES: hypothetical protein [unclassified Paracoccus (in: a-proteobacteria)]
MSAAAATGNKEVIAFCQTHPSAGADEDTLRAHAAVRLSAYRVPSHIVICARLPAAPSGKILKHRLLDHFTDQPD